MAADSDIDVRQIENANNAFKELTEQVKGASKSIGGSMVNSASKASTSFTDLLGPMKLITSAAKAAAEAVKGMGSSIPILGGITHAAGVAMKASVDVAAGAIEQFAPLLDKQLAVFRETAAVGGFATNNLKGFADTAKDAGLLMEEYKTVVVENSKSLRFFGSTVSNGAEGLTTSLTKMKNAANGNYASLINLGYTQKEIAEFTVKQGEWAAKNGLRSQRTADGLAASTYSYMIELDQISRITGMNRKDLMKDREERQKEVRWRSALNNMGDKQKAAAEGIASSLAGFPELQEGVKDLIASGGVPLTEAGKKLTLAMPNIGEVMQKFRAGGMSMQDVLTSIGEGAKAFDQGSGGLTDVAQYVVDANNNIATGLIAVLKDVNAMRNFSQESFAAAAAERAERIKGGGGTEKDIVAAEQVQRDFVTKMMEAAQDAMPAVVAGFNLVASTLDYFAEQALSLIQKLSDDENTKLIEVFKEKETKRVTAALDAERARIKEEYEKKKSEATGWIERNKVRLREQNRKKSSNELALEAELAKIRNFGMVDGTTRLNSTPEELKALQAEKKAIAAREVAAALTQKELAEVGLANARRVVENKTSKADGGIVDGPKSGFDAILHGVEAVVPLPDGKTIPVSMNKAAFKPLTDMVSGEYKSMAMSMDKAIADQKTTSTVTASAVERLSSIAAPSITVDTSSVSDAITPLIRSFDKTSTLVTAAAANSTNDAKAMQGLLASIRDQLATMKQQNKPADPVDFSGLEAKLTELTDIMKQSAGSTESVELLSKAVRSLEEQTRISKNILNASM